MGALSKQTTFKALGWWQYGAEVYREWGLGALERELDGGGALAVSGLTVASVRSDPATAVQAYGLAVARIVELAVAAGRRPVIPAIDCAAPWIERHPNAFLGVRDRQHVIVSSRCDADSAAASVLGGGGGDGGGGGGGEGGKEGLGTCCSSVNFDCNEGVILQIDMDRDPRYAHLHQDVAYVKLHTLLGGAGAAHGKVDGATLQAALKGPALVTIELGGEWEGTGDGAAGPGGAAAGGGEVPEVTNLTPQQRDRIDALFRGCEGLNCIPPRKPWPDHKEPCRRPD